MTSTGYGLLLLLVATTALAAKDDSKKQEEKPLRIVPLITSTPLTGTGVGAAASYLYLRPSRAAMNGVSAKNDTYKIPSAASRSRAPARDETENPSH